MYYSLYNKRSERNTVYYKMVCYKIFDIIICFIFGPMSSIKSECIIRINENVPERQPLVLYPKLGKGFIYPEEVGTDIIVIKTGESIRLACPGSYISFNTITNRYENALFQCIENSSFLLSTENIQEIIYRITCDENPDHTVRRTTVSCGIGVVGEIGFFITDNNGGKFYKIIDFCHNEQWSHTFYAHTQIPAAITASNRNIPRPGFVKGNFFQDIDVANVYRRKRQQKTFGNILYNNNSLAYKYIHNTGNYFLARGHLIAKRDMIYAAQQRATFYYINVVPMWQNINNGNWKRLEISIRNYASKKKCNLEVWAGALGVLKFKDINRNIREIYLHYENDKDKAIPVPQLLFKVAYDRQSKAGIVFVTANNPHLKIITDDYIICHDVCQKIDYIKWDTRYSRGYSYCCDIDDFRKSFDYLPYFKTEKLLI